MGATVCTAKIHDAFVSTDRTRTFYHGHSYTGNALAAAAGVASLRIFESEPVFERIAAIARIHDERLAAIRESSRGGRRPVDRHHGGDRAARRRSGIFVEAASEALPILLGAGRAAAAAWQYRLHPAAVLHYSRNAPRGSRSHRGIAGSLLVWAGVFQRIVHDRVRAQRFPEESLEESR